MIIEIDENNCIRLYREQENTPFLEQPYWPDQTPWASREQAQQWAEQYVAHLENPDENEPPSFTVVE
jgi:hypothetical protein